MQSTSPAADVLTGRRRTAIVTILAMVLTLLSLSPPSASSSPLETRLIALRDLTTASVSHQGAGGSAALERTSASVTTPMRFSMVAFEAPVDSEVLFRTADRGAWTDWEHADFLLPDEGPTVHTGPTAFTDPLWVRAADRLQVRTVGAAPEDVIVHLIDSTGLNRGGVSLALPSLGTPAEAATRPGFVTRAQWGADERVRREEPDYALPRMGIVHHTAGSNDYSRQESAAIVRGIYHYHVKVRGWSDIGYNFLIDKYGQVFEGRYGGVDRGVIGAHAANYNTGSFGVAVMGNFEGGAPPSAAMDALTRTIAWKFEMHGIDPRVGATLVHNGQRLPTLIGHRDVGSTACPGQALYDRLGSVHRRLDALVAPGWTPVVGDWDGDGSDDAGWFKNGHWRLVDEQDGTTSTRDFWFGREGDRPLVGDWNGDGTDEIAVVRGIRWYLKYDQSGGAADRAFDYGRPGDIALPGNWDGKPGDEAGVIRDGTWYLNDRLNGGVAPWSFRYGRIKLGDLPLVGDWLDDGEDRDLVGIVRDGEWHLRYEYEAGPADEMFTYGRVLLGDAPVVGDWDGNDTDRPAVIRGSGWYLRNTLGSGPADTFRAIPTPDAAKLP